MNLWNNNFISSNMNNGYNNNFFNNNGYGYNNMNVNSNGLNYQSNNNFNNFNNNGMTSYNINSNNYNNGYLNNQNNFYQQNNFNNGNYNNQNNYNQQFNINNYNNNINNQNNYNQQINSANYINNNNNQYNFNFNGQNFINNNSNENRIQQANQNYFYNNNNSNNNIKNFTSFNQQSKNKNNQFQNRARNQNQPVNNNNQRNKNQYNNNYNNKQNIDINQDIGKEQNKGMIYNKIYKNLGTKLNTDLSNQNKNKIYNNINLTNNQNNPRQNNTSNKNQNLEKIKYNNIKNSIKIDNKVNLNPKTMYQTGIQNKNKIILDFFTRATGLDNVGATCYMNATLQCLYHVKELSENIINDDTIKDKLKLTFCYKNLIEELAGCKEKKKYLLRRQEFSDDKYMKDSIKPLKFKNLISEMNPIFKGVQANDSKDLILFLLETMDKELTLRNNKTREMQTFYGNSEDELKPENFKKCHNSIFADIFYGFQKSVIKCEKCKTENPTYNVMNFLIFHLEKTYNELNKQKNNNNNNMNDIMNNINTQYNMNNQNNMNNQFNINNPYFMNNQYLMNNQYNMNNMYNNMHRNMNNYLSNHSNNYNNFRNGINQNPLRPLTNIGMRRCKNNIMNMNNIQNEKKKLTLDECFKNNRNAENLTGDNQIYCNNCQCDTNAVMYDEIHLAPNVLIIILNRGKGNIFECDVDYPDNIDLSKYITNPASPKKYELIGVISHLGQSSLEGHFIAYCKHFDDCRYIFNDSLVKQIGDKKDFKGIPYILFYKKSQEQ